MSGNNTSGYEIRQGLLGQAQDILQTNAHMHYERTKEWGFEHKTQVCSTNNLRERKLCFAGS